MAEEKICGEPANFRYTWPGKDEAFACIDHANGIARVAQAIGLYLQIILVDYNKIDPASFPTCQSRIE